MTRWNGSYLGTLKNTATGDSGGIWNLKRQTLAKQLSTWPLDNSTVPLPNWSLDFSSGEPWIEDVNYSYNSLRQFGSFTNNLGYIQPYSVNLCFNSETFENWNRDGLLAFGSGSVSNSSTAPNGTETADLLTETNTNGQHGMYSNGNSLSVEKNNIPYTFSIYAKKPATNGRNYISIGAEYGGVGSFKAIFDIVTGAYVSSYADAGLTVQSYSITPVNNNWFRCSITITCSGSGYTTGGSMRIGPSTVNSTNYYGLPSYQGDGVSGILVWGAQVEPGATTNTYTKTTNSYKAIPRLTHDRNGNRLGLLIEESVTNGLLQSELYTTTWQSSAVSITANATTSPSGLNNASKLTETATTAHVIYQDVTRTNVVFSAYMKKAERIAASLKFWITGNNWLLCTFNLDAGTSTAVFTGTGSTFTSTGSGMENVGNGWYRCWIRATVPSNTSVQHSVAINSTPTPTRRADNGGEDYTAVTGNGLFIWGLQSEGFNRNPSSYIPTTTAAVTRNEDKAHVLKSLITNWNTPGTVVVHFYPPSQAGTLLSTDDTTAEQLGIQASSTTAARAFWSNGNTVTGEIGTTVLQKAAHYFDGSSSKFCINGTDIQTSTNNIATFSNIAFLTLGAEATETAGVPNVFSAYSNCIIRKVEFYAGQISDLNLQAITNNGSYTSQYLVVAGGGGGGYGGAGGGGAGGYRESAEYTLIPGINYSITVGAGGAGATVSNVAGGSGTGSSLGTITSTGGGVGGNALTAGASGGSGGGAGGWGNGLVNPGTGTAGQGFDGGSNGFATTNGSPWAAGGGGGANNAGSAPPVVGTGGSGGNGKTSTITGSSDIRGGGGGGGVTAAGGTIGAGGTGGGGTGGTTTVERTSGITNTGGGGGGGAGGGTQTGGNGGSGVVIIRVPTFNYSGVYTGSPTISTVGSDTVLVFNASGSYRG
jgi:hypothetical protein